jgi:hypothetical protein
MRAVATVRKVDRFDDPAALVLDCLNLPVGTVLILLALD